MRAGLVCVGILMGAGCFFAVLRHQRAVGRLQRAGESTTSTFSAASSPSARGVPQHVYGADALPLDAASKEAAERHTMARLRALPCAPWQPLPPPPHACAAIPAIPATPATPATGSAGGAGGEGGAGAEGRSSEGEGACCALCLLPYEAGELVRTLPCSHTYHQACIDDWFAATKFRARTCPLCKADPLGTGGADEPRELSRETRRPPARADAADDDTAARAAACARHEAACVPSRSTAPFVELAAVTVAPL